MCVCVCVCVCVIVITVRVWADIGLWVAVCFLRKFLYLYKTTFARLTQSQAISQSIAFSSLSDQWERRKSTSFTFFIFQNSFFFYRKLPFPWPWWSKDLLVENLHTATHKPTSAQPVSALHSDQRDIHQIIACVAPCCVSSVSKSCEYVVSVEGAAYVVVEGVEDIGEVECEWGRTSVLLICAFRFLRLLFVLWSVKACPAILDRWFWVLALPLVVAPPNLQNQLTLTSEGAWNYHGFDRSLQNASVWGEGLEKYNPGKSVCKRD